MNTWARWSFLCARLLDKCLVRLMSVLIFGCSNRRGLSERILLSIPLQILSAPTTDEAAEHDHSASSKRYNSNIRYDLPAKWAEYVSPPRSPFQHSSCCLENAENPIVMVFLAKLGNSSKRRPYRDPFKRQHFPKSNIVSSRLGSAYRNQLKPGMVLK